MQEQYFPSRTNEAFSTEEEKSHIWSHAIGVLLSLIYTVVLFYRAIGSDVKYGLVAALTFSLAVLIMFLCSTFYHASKEPTIKKYLRKLDHISIYFLIAGTYTPFIIHYYFDSSGKWLLLLLWILVAFGTLFKLFYTGRWKIISLSIYLLMGWSGVFSYDAFFSQMPTLVFWLVATGGLLYTAGVGFYLWSSLKYHHFIWHLFVLAAVGAHAMAVFYLY